MAALLRTVPIVLRPAGSSEPCRLFVAAVGGQPALDVIGSYLELDVQVDGEPDPQSGYLMSISEIDAAVRATLPAALDEVNAILAASQDARSLEQLLRSLAERLPSSLQRTPTRLTLRATPYCSISLDSAMPETLHLTRRFDFCAAHRLAIPELSDAENFARFGKCSHPSGHGHNYRLDVTVSRASKSAVNAVPWESIVEREVIERYDHRHLNSDCEEFRSLNPSVENIARTIHERLAPHLSAAGVTLDRVCVWETEKTWCAYPA